MVLIDDGRGGGRKAAVNVNNHLLCDAVTTDIETELAFQGNSYNVNTGTVNLTTTGSSALLYFKNTGTKNAVVHSLVYLLGGNPAVSGSENSKVEILRNPTAGTIVTNTVSQDPINRDFGSTRTMNADCYKGVEGDTFTDGTVAIESIFSSTGRKVVSVGALVLPKGSSIGVRVTPPPQNTDWDVQMAMSISYDGDGITENF